MVDAEGRALVEADPPRLVYLDPASRPGRGAAVPGGRRRTTRRYFAVVADLPRLPGARAANLRDVGAGLSGWTPACSSPRWRSPAGTPLTGTPRPPARRRRWPQGGWVRVDAAGRQRVPAHRPGHHRAGARRREPARRAAACSATTPPGAVPAGRAALLLRLRRLRRARRVGRGGGGPGGARGGRHRRLRAPLRGQPGLAVPGFADAGLRRLRRPGRGGAAGPVEIAEARWFTRAEIAAILAGEPAPVRLPSPASIAHHLIRRWLADD